MKFNKLVIIILFSSIITLSGCVYRMDIEQGNRISTENLANLKPGLTKKQVIFLVGEPAIEDLFHVDQWYYVYYIKHGHNQDIEQKSMRLIFEGNYLTEVIGDLEITREKES